MRTNGGRARGRAAASLFAFRLHLLRADLFLCGRRGSGGALGARVVSFERVEAHQGLQLVDDGGDGRIVREALTAALQITRSILDDADQFARDPLVLQAFWISRATWKRS